MNEKKLHTYNVRWTQEYWTTVQAESAQEAKQKAKALVTTAPSVLKILMPGNRGNEYARRLTKSAAAKYALRDITSEPGR